MVDDETDRSGGEEGSPLEPRPPEQDDLVALCRALNELGARYLIVGGFAIIHAGYPRFTMDLDLVMKKDTHREKDAADLLFLRKWFEARGESLPD